MEDHKTYFTSIEALPVIETRPSESRRDKFSWTSTQQLYEDWIENWWLSELFSWLVSAVCIGTIGVVLLRVNGQPTGSQPIDSATLTPNSIISVLSGVAKAALLLPTAEAVGQLKWSWFFRNSRKLHDFETFDMASRGPWGSIRLLSKIKERPLVTIGAIVTILSLAIDPFFQQILVVRQRWVGHTQGQGFIPQAQRYEGSTIQFDVTMLGEPVYQADPYMHPFVDSLFLGEELTPTIPGSCPTSNCTWDPFDSLAVCSSCHDISDLLRYTCRNATVDWLHNSTLEGNEFLPITEVCGFFLNATSEKPVLMTGHASGSSPGKEGLQEVLVARILPLLDVEQAKTIFDGSIHFKNIINPIADYLTVSAPNGVPSVYGNSTPVAQECVLHWCTKRLSVSNYQGKVTLEQVGAPTIQTGKAPFPWSLGHPMGERPNVIFNANFTFKPPNQPLAFSVSNDTMFQTVTCLQDFLPSFLTGYNGRSTMPFRFANFDGAPYVKDMTFNPLADIAALNDRVGLMMTKVLLTVANGTNRLGSSWENVVYYHVRWAWMSLPIVLLLFSLTFLLATIFRSKEEQDIGIRKNSALAALLNGLTDNVRGEVGLASSSSTGDACIKAKHVRVKLLLNKENQYRLSDKTELSWTASYDLQQG